MEEEKYVLKVCHLKKYYKTQNGITRAVDDISFELGENEVLCLVGESGCGKTTLGKSILQLIQVEEGTIWFLDECLFDSSSKKKRKQKIHPMMQMIFQDSTSTLDPRMSVKEIIGEGLRIKKYKKSEIDSEVKRMLELVGLSQRSAECYPIQLSQGQRQRVAIARALIVKPKLLIADEPISSIDVSMQSQVLNLLRELKEVMGLSILFITHDLAMAKFFSDRIGVMYRGRIVEMGSTKEILRYPLHSYTRTLISAIPIPDPNYERNKVIHSRNIENYLFHPVGEIHDYMINENHTILCEKNEIEMYRRLRKEMNCSKNHESMSNRSTKDEP